MSVILRPSAARGHADHGWLDTRHSFSFAHYFDPAHMGFRTLRVINEDVVLGGGGFGMHGHHDMEIVTYMVSGALEHRDSTGNRAVIRAGEVQRMTAGTGIRHSEINASASEAVKLLQIWILPEEEGLEPGYEQTLFAADAKRNRLLPIVRPGGGEGALSIHQDATIYASILETGKTLSHPLAQGRGAWLQLVSGQLTVNGKPLVSGDGLALEDVPSIEIVAGQESEFLLFDLA